jgi:hypothetical protein
MMVGVTSLRGDLMPIRITCPGCQRGINAPEKYAGKVAKCPGCGAALKIPFPEPVTATIEVEARRRTNNPPPPPPLFTDERVSEAAAPPLSQSAAGRRSEQTLYEATPDMVRDNLMAIIVGGLFLIAGLGQMLSISPLIGLVTMTLGGLLFLYSYLKSITTRITVTSGRTILRKGILSKMTREVRHTDVRLLEVSQSIMQRLLGVGTVKVASSAHGSIEIECAGLLHPEQVKNVIDENRPD